jgi:hypothetical protein
LACDDIIDRRSNLLRRITCHVTQNRDIDIYETGIDLQGFFGSAAATDITFADAVHLGAV